MLPYDPIPLFDSSYMSLRHWLGVGVVIVLASVGGFFLIRRSTPSDSPPLKIGAIFPMTGGLAQYGDLASKSSLLAIEEINRAGGIQGRMLELDVQDHQCKPATAIVAYQHLSTLEHVRYFLAAGCSGTVIAVNPLLDHQVMLGSAISSPKVSGTSPRFFRNYGTDSAEGKLFAEVIQQRGFSSVGVLHEETDYAKGLMISLKENLNSAISFTAESFASDATDVRTQITKLRGLNPEVFFLSPQTVTTANIALKQMRELGYKPKNLIVNENVMKSEQLRMSYPDILNGATSADFKVQDSQALQNFLQAYKTRFGVDCAQTNVCATSYDNVHMLGEALRHVGDDDAKIADYFKTISYNGVSGHISFNGQNDRDAKGYVLFSIKEGTPIAQP